MTSADKIRNLAIIAHIDHGKTTLIDSIFRGARTFRENQQMGERVMDSQDLERERGITIRAKHCTVTWGDYLINIIDTPGHSDFSGEVERVLGMVNSVLLLVDANEGPMPQTRYVLMRSLRLGLNPIVFINKVDRPGAHPQQALEKTFDLFIELGANDRQADFPVLYGSGLEGWAVSDLDHEPEEGMDALFKAIIEHVPAPSGDPNAPFLLQVGTLAWSDYIGRIGCGRVRAGRIAVGDGIRRTRTRWLSPTRETGWEVEGTSVEKVTHLWVTRGLDRVPVEEVGTGDIVWLAGPEDITIGDTLSDPAVENAALQPLEIEEPTVSMLFLVNNGPFAGEDGKVIMLRQIRERLERELRTNVALRVEDVGRGDGLKVSGRGEFHLAILIEEMTREGLEICVSRPEVITRNDEKGNLLEPMEQLIVDVPQDYHGVVIEKLARRKGEMVSMDSHGVGGLTRLEFEIPTRGLIGYRNDFLTDTRGLGIMASRFIGYGPWRGEVVSRTRGSLVSMETGPATSYQLESLQERTTLFVEPTERVYAGQIVGENSRPGDMPCNPTKRKVAGNFRASAKEQTVGLDVPRKMTLDQALEWIAADELVEATPKGIRLRKATLSAEARKLARRRETVLRD